MAKVGPKTVRHIAQLAQLELSEDQLEQAAIELSAILDHMAAISDFEINVQTTDVGPVPRRRPDAPATHASAHLIQAPTKGTEVAVPQVKDAS